MTSAIANEICRLEECRARALVTSDWDGLAALIADDLVHIHATGLVEDKAAYLEGVRSKLEFLEVRRESLTVRSYGELAVATGILRQVIRIKATGAIAKVSTATTQTWVKRDSTWLQNTFQATRLEH